MQNQRLLLALLSLSLATPTTKYLQAAEPLRLAQKTPDEDPGAHTAPKTNNATTAQTPVVRPSLEEAWTQARTYDFGQSHAPLDVIDDSLRGIKTPAQKTALAQQFTTLLQNAQTVEAKRYACRQLQVWGDENSVPALAIALRDANTSTHARLALQSLQFPAATAALRAALNDKTLAPTILIGVVQSLGERGDTAAVPQLATLVQNADTNLSAMALWALGRIGNAGATTALSSALKSTNAAIQTAAGNALLNLANGLLGSKRGGEAAPLLQQVYAAPPSPTLRGAALRGLVLAQPQEAAKLLQSTLGGTDDTAREVAVTILPTLLQQNTVAKTALLNWLRGDDAQLQTPLLNALSAIESQPNGADWRAAIVQNAGSANPAVRLAAVRALANWGDSAALPVLMKIAATGEKDEKAAAQQSLERMRGNLGAALQGQLKTADPATQVVLLQAMANRRESNALPLLINAATHTDEKVRAAALTGLGAAGTIIDVPALVALVAKLPGERERGALEKSFSSIYSRSDAKTRPAEATTAVVDALQKATGEPAAPVRASLVRVLGGAADAPAIIAVRGALKDSNADVRDAAVRTLANWPDGAAMTDLQTLAKSAEKPAQQILALRGYVRLIGASNSKPADKVTQLQTAMELATRPDEKKIVLGEAGKIANPAALEYVAKYFDTADVQAEALAAAVAILQNNYNSYSPGRKLEKETLARLLATTKDANLKKTAGELSKKSGA